MALFARFEIVLAKLGSCCCAARTTVRFSPHERTYGAGTVIRSPICHPNGWRCRLPVAPLDFPVTYCRAPLVVLPYFNLIFLKFCSSSSWRCYSVIFFKSSCSQLFCLLRISARTSWCTGFCILYPCSQSFGVQ